MRRRWFEARAGVESARRVVGRLGGAERWALATEPDLPPPLRHALVRWADTELARRLAERTDLSGADVARLRRLVDPDCEVALLAHPAAPRWWVRAVSTSPEPTPQGVRLLAAAAASARLDPERRREMVASDRPLLLRAVARNPTIDGDDVERLMATDEPSVIVELARHPDPAVQARAVDWLIVHDCYDEPVTVARRRDLSRDLAERLARAPRPTIHLALVQNPATPEDIVHRLVTEGSGHPQVERDGWTMLALRAMARDDTGSWRAALGELARLAPPMAAEVISALPPLWVGRVPRALMARLLALPDLPRELRLELLRQQGGSAPLR